MIPTPRTTEPTMPAAVDSPDAERAAVGDRLAWSRQPRLAQLYVVAVVLAGIYVFVAFFPRTLPPPGLFALLLAIGCITSVWKVTLPIPLASGSTLSVS